jgi:hypothetical protein
MMRRFVTALSFAAIAAVALSSPSSAQEAQYTTGVAGPATGAVVGTAVGVGLYNGWYSGVGSSLTAATSTTAGAVAIGGVAGIGTVALIDGVFQPCRGFHALFGANKDACVNGEYVGYSPRRMR